jgi:nucleotide-binding universal stress UspA family protein
MSNSCTLTRAGEQADQEGHEALFLALATHGRAALEGRAVSSNIAVRVLEHSALPLLIVRAKEDQDGA